MKEKRRVHISKTTGRCPFAKENALQEIEKGREHSWRGKVQRPSILL
jgi:hypothetical protein